MIERCTGEAHKNAFIDHCGICLGSMAGWGWTVTEEQKPQIGEWAGLIETRKNKICLGGWVSVYVASDANFDPEGGKYVTVCESHKTLCNHKTLKNARYHLSSVDWCESCMEIRGGLA